MSDERAPRRRLNPRFVLLCVLLALTLAVIAVGLGRLLAPSPAPEEADLPAYVVKDYLPVNEWSRPGDELKEIRGVVIHYVGNPGTSARANRNYFASLASGKEQTYASNSRNDDTVSVEVCHPDETGEFSPVTYQRCVELTAWLCRTCRLDAEKDVIRHYDVTGKLCPLYYAEHPEAWETFLADVAEAVRGLEEAEKAA